MQIVQQKYSGLFRQFILFTCFFLLSYYSTAQNLVINPGMEDTARVIIGGNGFNKIYQPGTPLAPFWVTATSSSADYYNSNQSTITGQRCVLAHRGQGRIGLIAGCRDLETRRLYKEYAMGKFTQPLQRDHYYKISFYVALDPSSHFAMDSLGCYISVRPVSSTNMTVLSFRPQIIQEDDIITSKDGWTKISGLYLASGDEQYITIGTFSRKTRIPISSLGETRTAKAINSRVGKFAYYYIDDVEVEEYDTTKGFNLNKEEVIVEPKADRFLLLVDVSQSMGAEGKLDSVKNALKTVYKNLPPHSELSIVTFSSEPQLLLPFTTVSSGLNIETAIDSLSAQGSTMAVKSIEFAYDYLSQAEAGRKTTVFFFTDGIFELAPSSGALIKSHYKSYGTKFSTFQFGDRVNNDLSKIASITDGTYTENAHNNLADKLSEEMYSTRKNTVEKEMPVRGKSKPGIVILRYTVSAALLALIAYRLGIF